MLYRSLERIAAEAEVLAAPDLPAAKPAAKLRTKPPLSSRRARLERWAELLEPEPGRRLRAIHGIEHVSPRERKALRADGSPLSVAYADPVLRAAGLRSDTVGDAAEFFGLWHGQLHQLLCSCHHGEGLEAASVAAQIRAFTRPRKEAMMIWAIGLGFGAAVAAGPLAVALF